MKWGRAFCFFESPFSVSIIACRSRSIQFSKILLVARKAAKIEPDSWLNSKFQEFHLGAVSLIAASLSSELFL